MAIKQIIGAVSALLFGGCANSDTSPPASAPEAAKSHSLPASPTSNSTTPWQSDSLLKDRFHPEYPNDLQVIVHDGGPRFSEAAPELVWVTVTGKVDTAYRATILNQPHGLKTVSQGDEILFLMVAGAEHPFRVSQQYLAERTGWVIQPCSKCGFPELFDAPSSLMKKIFPNTGPNEEVEAFTSFCPMCRGVQVIHKPGIELD